MNGQNVAYIRVSSTDQETARQLAGMTFDRVFEEKASGSSADRPQLQECMSYLRQGDVLHVHSIDRLARNLLDLQRIIEKLLAKGVGIRFHKEGLTFTGDDNPFQKLQLQIIGAVAEFERAIIRERQREGILAAKKRGKHLGRPRRLTIDQIREIRQRKDSAAALAREYEVSRQTIYDARRGVGAYAGIAEGRLDIR
nr:recombinase family protein [Desulfolithobacter dissulfuricans]